MEILRKRKGITLIALIVTIIILLILAGVTLSLIAGSDGILTRATGAVDANKIESAKEQVDMRIADFQSEYYDAKYVSRTEDGEKVDYITERLAGNTQDYAIRVNGKKIAVYERKQNTEDLLVSGTIQNDCSIQWDDEPGNVTPTPENPDPENPDPENPDPENPEPEELIPATPEELKNTSTIISYNPSGTYNWQAKYCSSTKTETTDDVLLDSGVNEDGTANPFHLEQWKVLSYDEATGIVKMVSAALPERNGIFRGSARLQ